MPEQATELLVSMLGIVAGGGIVQFTIFLLRRREDLRAIEDDTARLANSLARAANGGISLLDQGSFERDAVLDGVKLLYTRGEIDVDEFERRVAVVLATEIDRDA